MLSSINSQPFCCSNIFRSYLNFHSILFLCLIRFYFCLFNLKIFGLSNYLLTNSEAFLFLFVCTLLPVSVIICFRESKGASTLCRVVAINPKILLISLGLTLFAPQDNCSLSISLIMVCLVARTGRHLQRYDNLGRRQVVGCIPYRYKCSSDGTISNDLEVLVISSQKGQKMMFPKGGWELDESREEAALRESLEEAGVLGIVECELGKWDFISKSHGTFYEGYMFPLLVKEELDFWPEQHVRQRTWLNVKEARDVCQHWWMKEALDKLVERLTSLQQQKEESLAIRSLI